MLLIDTNYPKKLENKFPLLNQLRKSRFDNNTWLQIDFNFNNEYLKLLDYRKIFMYSIDFDKLIEDIPEIRISKNFLYDEHPSYRPHSYKCSIEKVEKILFLNNWKRGNDGIYYKNNKPLKFNLVTFENVDFLNIIVESLIKQLLNVGILLSVEKVSPDILFSEIYSHGDDNSFDLLLHAWSGNPFFEKGEMYASRINSFDNIPSKNNNYKGSNISLFCNNEYDKLFNNLNEEKNMKYREIILEEMSNLFNKRNNCFTIRI